ncbi:MAG: ribosomal protein S18-alanine N-acetyltransferase [Acutalibacteraceae bacterium]
MNNIQIVPMAAEHISAIASIERECFSAPWSEKALAEELDVPSAVFVTALADGEVAGYVGMHHLDDVGYICNVAVSSDYRGMGIGGQLLEYLIDYARKNSLSEITLEVRTSNQAARKLYEKSGFERLGTRPNFYSNPKENAEIYSRFFGN